MFARSLSTGMYYQYFALCLRSDTVCTLQSQRSVPMCLRRTLFPSSGQLVVTVPHHTYTQQGKKRYLILPHTVFELNKSPLKFVMRNPVHLIKQCLKCRIYISQKNFNKNIVAIEQCKNSAEKYYSSLNARGIFHKRAFPLKQKALS